MNGSCTSENQSKWNEFYMIREEGNQNSEKIEEIMKVLKGKEGVACGTLRIQHESGKHLRLIHPHISVILHHSVQLFIFAKKIWSSFSLRRKYEMGGRAVSA